MSRRQHRFNAESGNFEGAMQRILLVLFFLFGGMPAHAQSPFAVVELFTSEGCSSCPPAEKVLSTLKAEAEKDGQAVYFLEFHVDYWNRLGWKDPFSRNQFTFRQENYSRVLPGKELYTPQMIVNGRKDFTGSSESTARDAIRKALDGPASGTLRIDSQQVVSDTLRVTYSAGHADKNAAVKIAVTEDGLSTEVAKGENAGQTLHHEAVVRIFFSSQSVQAQETVKVPLHGFSPRPGMRLVLFVQHKQTQHISAAAGTIF
jgi:hypothetical protein